MGSCSGEGTINTIQNRTVQRRRSGRIYSLEAALTGAMGWDRGSSCMAGMTETREEGLYGRKKNNGLQRKHERLYHGSQDNAPGLVAGQYLYVSYTHQTLPTT